MAPLPKAPISLAAAAAAARNASLNTYTSCSKETTKKRMRDAEEVSSENDNMNPSQHPPRAKKVKKVKKSVMLKLASAPTPCHCKVTNGPVLTRPCVNMRNMTRHPAIDAFGLDPTSVDNFLVVIDDPTEKERIIFCATSEMTVYEEHIPYDRIIPQISFAPFLKAGPHGYDWDNSKWYIPLHKDATDLHTGRRHQVEPADQERMRMNPSFETEFLMKYPGIRAGAHQWPCGCYVARDEYDSEEE